MRDELQRVYDLAMKIAEGEVGNMGNPADRVGALKVALWAVDNDLKWKLDLPEGVNG